MLLPCVTITIAFSPLDCKAPRIKPIPDWGAEVILKWPIRYIVLATLTRVNWDWGHCMFYALFASFVSGQT